MRSPLGFMSLRDEALDIRDIDVYSMDYRHLYIMPKTDNLQGALEVLVLKLLRRGPNHGYAISVSIQ